MLEGLANLATLFAVLHDGEIVAAELDGAALRLRVDIPYLARLIQADYTWVAVTLHAVQALRFLPWTAVATPPFTAVAAIFAAPLTILDSASAGQELLLNCNQTDHAYDYCGGQLMLQASAASVHDQAGNPLPLEALIALAAAYWDAFARSSGAQ